MVITFLIALFIILLILTAFIIFGQGDAGEALMAFVSWFLGAMTAACAYVLWYQLFPVK